VTGLTTVDTGTTFTFFGQLVIVLVIQIGGIGITTLSTVFLMIAGKRLSMTGQVVIHDTFTHSKDQRPLTIVKDVILLTLVLEGIGAIALFFRFYPRFDVLRAIWHSIFHAVSAFCNAGFSLFPDNLIGYQEDWIVNLDICFLIITGGIGFLVMSEIKLHIMTWRRQSRMYFVRLTLHTKLVLSATILLLIVGTVFILILEWNNTLAHLPLSSKLLAAFFQSVTPRTAGFNTVPYGSMANVTLFITIILMFIGASPGSCGGGIKTTTFSALSLRGLASLFGLERTQVFHRSIPESSVYKALSVTMVSIGIVTVGTLILLISEVGNVPHAESRYRFIEIMFEVVSAFGTVGLSTGLTPYLTVIGKLTITFIMFLGRLGPLVVALAISRQHKSCNYYYAEEKIMVG
jgi:trk system potassium uptake protein TrkH